MTARINPIAPRLKWDVLSPGELERIHDATLEIMEEVGIRFPSDRVLTVLDENGCEVDRATQLAKLPRALIMAAVSKAPGEYVLAGRDPAADMLIDGKHCYLSNDGSGVFVFDHKTGEKRPSTKNDAATSARFVDALPNISYYWGPVVTSQDVPPATKALHDAEAVFNNTSKHFQTVTTVGEKPARYLVEMAAAIAGGVDKLRERPILSFMQCAVDPLGHDGPNLEANLVAERVHRALHEAQDRPLAQLVDAAGDGRRHLDEVAGRLLADRGHRLEVLAGVVQDGLGVVERLGGRGYVLAGDHGAPVVADVGQRVHKAGAGGGVVLGAGPLLTRLVVEDEDAGAVVAQVAVLAVDEHVGGRVAAGEHVLARRLGDRSHDQRARKLGELRGTVHLAAVLIEYGEHSVAGEADADFFHDLEGGVVDAFELAGAEDVPLEAWGDGVDPGSHERRPRMCPVTVRGWGRSAGGRERWQRKRARPRGSGRVYRPQERLIVLMLMEEAASMGTV